MHMKCTYKNCCNLKLHNFLFSFCFSVLKLKTLFLQLEVDMRFKVKPSPTKYFFLFASVNALENDEKCFLFYVKISFCS